MNKRVAKTIARDFKLEGKIKDINSFGNGHINKTFIIEADKKYILQEINSYVFKDVKALMHNIDYVTSYLKKNKINTLNIVKTNDNKNYLKYENTYFRMYEYVENSKCYESISNDLEMVRITGEAFARFHKDLDALDASKIKDVIPEFHNTYKRYNDLLDALNKADKKLVESCKNEVGTVCSFNQMYPRIVEKIHQGIIKEHIIHGDPKLNNILFDKDTNEVLCIIDLDTIMKGSYLYDIGDAYRTLFTGEYEDSKDTSKVRLDLNVFKAYLEGYLSVMKDTLSKEEISLIPFSAFLLTMEVAIRFLEDYLRGNVYYHVTYTEHNLVRARTQLKLACEIYNNMDVLNTLTANTVKELER